jgi:hypothetical protein
MSLGSPIDGLDIAVGLLRGWAGHGRHLQPPRLNRESYTQRGRPDP